MKMEKTVSIISLLITLILSFVTLFFNKTFALCIFMGSVFATTSFLLLSYSYRKTNSTALKLILYLSRMLLMVLPFIIALSFKDMKCLIFTFLGNIINTVILLIYGYLYRKEDS